MAASKPSAEQLITENIDVWTSAIKKRGSQGRGSSKKTELYGIKKLRELILELAVRGLLVPQDPADEPASVLLEKIAAEKEELIADGKIKKQKPLPEITEEEKTFDLPNGWAWVRLGTLFNSIMSGGTPSKRESTYWGGDIPWASVKDLGAARYISKTQDYITKEGLEAGSKLSDAGDVLICTRMGLGKIAIATAPIAINQDLKAVKLSSAVNVEYFLNTYSTLKIKGTGTTVAGIKQEELLNYVIGLPAENEVPCIVAKVNELMALCDQLEQQTETSLTAHQTLVETLLNTLLTAAQTTPTNTNKAASSANSSQESSFDQAWNRIAQHFDVLFTTEHSIDQLKQTILQLAVMGKLVPQDPNDEPASVLLEKIAAEKEQLIKDKKIKKQKALPPIGDDEKPFELPQGWAWVRLGAIISLISGQHLKPAEYFEVKSENAVPYITGPAEFGELNPTYSKFTNEKRALAEDGDILITCKGSGLGKWNVAHEIIAISRQLMAIRPIELNDEYLKLVIDSKYDLFQSKGVGIAIPGISREDITDVLIGLPCEAELYRITEKVRKLMALCYTLKERLQKSQTTQIYLADAMAEQALS